MTISFARAYSLVPRGAAGLACDDDGVALGPMPLIEAVTDASGRRCYRICPEAEVARAFRLAYGLTPDEIERYRRGLARVTRLLGAGEEAQARLEAVLLAAPEIAPEGMAKLAEAAALRKANPDWPDQPRNPAGTLEGGRWTSEEGERGRIRMFSRPRRKRTMSKPGRSASLTRMWPMRRRAPTSSACRSRISLVYRPGIRLG